MTAVTPPGAAPTCQRCGVFNDTPPLATTRQTYQAYKDWPAHWPDTVTLRCDSCAQALRDYVALPSIRDSFTITSDVKL